jgi:hypothetical protein
LGRKIPVGTGFKEEVDEVENEDDILIQDEELEVVA